MDSKTGAASRYGAAVCPSASRSHPCSGTELRPHPFPRIAVRSTPGCAPSPHRAPGNSAVRRIRFDPHGRACRAGLTGCNRGSPRPPKPPPVCLPSRSPPARARRNDSRGEEWRGREQRSSRRGESRPSPNRKPERQAPCLCPCGDGRLARPGQRSCPADCPRSVPVAERKTHTAFLLAVIVQVLLECVARPIRRQTPSLETLRLKDRAPQNLRDLRPLPPPLENCSPPRSATNPPPCPA